MSEKTGKELKQTKKRTWLLYVFVAILVISAGILTYKIVNATIGNGEISSGEIVKYTDEGGYEIEGSDYYAAIKRKHDFEDFWSGSKSGGVVEWVMNDVITHNKKYPDEPIQLIFGNMDCGANTNCITEKKKKLSSMNDYEISYEYNKKGEVYMVRISGSGGPTNYFMLVPLVMVVIITLFIIFSVIKTARNGRKITKKAMNIMEDDGDEF